MNTLASIVAAIDFSEQARSAAERAALIAQEQRATLRLLHVVSSSSLDDLRNLVRGSAAVEESVLDEAHATLREAADALRNKTGVTAQKEVVTGQVIAVIRAAAEEADLLVLGARGTNPLRDLVLGTTPSASCGSADARPWSSNVPRREPMDGSSCPSTSRPIQRPRSRWPAWWLPMR